MRRIFGEIKTNLLEFYLRNKLVLKFIYVLAIFGVLMHLAAGTIGVIPVGLGPFQTLLVIALAGISFIAAFAGLLFFFVGWLKEFDKENDD